MVFASSPSHKSGIFLVGGYFWPLNHGTFTLVAWLLIWRSMRSTLSSFRGTHSRWFGYLQSLPRETVDIAIFWGVDDVIETRPCTCLPRGCLNTENESSPVGEPPQQMTNIQCPFCVRLHDGQTAKKWFGATEFDREQIGLMWDYWIGLIDDALSNPSPPRSVSVDPSHSVFIHDNYFLMRFLYSVRSCGTRWFECLLL
ncbi:hypothetical protein JVU11DRAFT_6340 [Chiua virens]|nr:hypothetical protein JVU11DRAFT_6340 [Chiua virens]